MKKILIILLILLSVVAEGQIYADGMKRIGIYKYGWMKAATDTIGYFDSLGLVMQKPIYLASWTTATRPANPQPGYFGFNTDSATIEWYSNDWHQPGTGGGGGGSSYIFSTGLNNSSGTVTANLSTGVSGGQTIVGSTSTNSGLIIKATTGVGASGANIVFTGGNNGATEFARFLNNGDFGIGITPSYRLDVDGGNTRIGMANSSGTKYGELITSVSGSDIRLSFNRVLSGGENRIQFDNGGAYYAYNAGSGEVRLFCQSGGYYYTIFGNGSEKMRISGTGVGIGTTPSVAFHVSGTTRFDLGSDATGDVYYRNSSGNFTRLAAGANGDVLTLAAGIPSWTAPSAASDTTALYSPLVAYPGAGSDPDTVGIAGLTTLGTAGQSIRINAGGTGFEYYTIAGTGGIYGGSGTLLTGTTTVSGTGSSDLVFGGGDGITTIALNPTSYTTFDNGIRVEIRALTADATIAISDRIITVDATGGNVTLTLPAASASFASNKGNTFTFKRLDSSGNTITITRAGSDTIDGSTTTTLSALQAKDITANSTSTWIIH